MPRQDGVTEWTSRLLARRAEALLIAEGQERPLVRCEFVDCPARTGHIILGAFERPCEPRST